MVELSFDSQNVEWTAGMMESVRSKIAAPLNRQLPLTSLDLHIHLGREASDYIMSVVYQTFDGRDLEMVRRRGCEFRALVDDVSSCMRGARRRFFSLAEAH